MHHLFDFILSAFAYCLSKILNQELSIYALRTYDAQLLAQLSSCRFWF